MNQKSAIALLALNGWRQEQGGKHVKMVEFGHRPITLPGHRGGQYSKSLATAILKQAGPPKDSA